MIKITTQSCGCEELIKGDSLIDQTTDSQLGAPAPEPCACTPYEVLCCCGPQNGISVIQPRCQTLPDGAVVNNPAYDAQTDKSYWSYKFMTDCSSSTRGISNFVIPICQIIIAENIIVSEKIDGCGAFTPVPFSLSVNDPNFGPAPTGYQYIKIETNERFEKGVSVEYRLEIVGNYPIAIQPISVKAANDIYIFDCGCFQVPQCNPVGKLALTKDCNITILNNQATLNYHLTVSNIGDGILQNVQFLDTVTIPINLIIGTITVTPSTLNVNTSTIGQIVISGNLGTLNPGGQIVINYTIPISGVTSPGSYVVTNSAVVSATGTQAFASCSTTVSAAQLDARKCCTINQNEVDYRFNITSVGLSPSILVDVFDNLSIPGGLTVQFIDFSGCTATFADSSEPVPLFTNITGPRRIRILCNSLLIPQSGNIHKDIVFRIISSDFVGIRTIENVVETVTPVNPQDQLFLGTNNLPAQANITVELTLDCSNPCT